MALTDSLAQMFPKGVPEGVAAVVERFDEAMININALTPRDGWTADRPKLKLLAEVESGKKLEATKENVRTTEYRSRNLDQREGQAREAARKTPDAAEIQRATLAHQALAFASTPQALALVVEDALLSENPLVVRTVVPAALAKLEGQYAALPQAARQGNTELTATINRLRTQLSDFEKANPTPAEPLRAVLRERAEVDMLVENDFKNIRRLIGIEPKEVVGAY